MKVLLVVMALMAVVPPEHLAPVVLTGAVALGLMVLIGSSIMRSTHFKEASVSAMKALLAAMAVVAVVRPEHLLSVALAIALTVGVVVVLHTLITAFKGGDSPVLTLPHPNSDRFDPS